MNRGQISEVCDRIVSAIYAAGSEFDVGVKDWDATTALANTARQICEIAASSIARHKWISVKESLPAKGAYVLVFLDGDMECAHYEGGDWWTGCNYEAENSHPPSLRGITHWLELPNSPSSSGNSREGG